MLQQEPNNLRITVPCRDVQRRVFELAEGRIDLRTCVQQICHDEFSTDRGRGNQRRVAVISGEIRIRSRSQEHSHDIPMPSSGSVSKRGP